MRGVVRLPDSRPRAAAAALGKPRTERMSPAVSETVVYLDSVPAKLEGKLARRARPPVIAQAFGHFRPRVAVVPVGGTVTFENQDRVYHNAFSLSPARKFDVGKVAPRESREVRFDRVGVVKVFCDLDPTEIGFVVVVPNHAFARPDSTGAFSLPKLPPGSYRLRVWHPRHRGTTRTFEVARRGDVTLDLRL